MEFGRLRHGDSAELMNSDARRSGIHHCCTFQAWQAIDPDLPVPLGNSHRFQLPLHDGHRRTEQHTGLGPHHGLTIPEHDVPDGPLTDVSLRIEENSIIKAPRHRLAQQIRLGDFTNVLEVRQHPLVLYQGHPQRPNWTIRRRTCSHQHIRYMPIHRRCELASGGVHGSGQGNISIFTWQRSAEMAQNRFMGQRVVKHRLRCRSQASQMQVKATHLTAANLHGGEVRITGEGQGREVAGAGEMPVTLGWIQCGRAWIFDGHARLLSKAAPSLNLDSAVKVKRQQANGRSVRCALENWPDEAG